MLYGPEYESGKIGSLTPFEPQQQSLTCDACGQEVAAVAKCIWDTDLMVGPCCETYTDHRCPDCGSDHLEFREYDYGTCSETGYHDAGVLAHCNNCGATCDIRDTEVKIGPMPERKPARMELPAIEREVRRG
jgi:hypothetical protein